MNAKVKICAAAMAVMLFAGASSVMANAAVYDTSQFASSPSGSGNESITESSWRKHFTLGAVRDKNVWSYGRKAFVIGNKELTVKSLTIGGKDYIPSRQASNTLGLSYSYNSKTGTSTVRGDGLEMTFTNGCYVSFANGRALFSTSPVVIMSDGRMYMPAEVFAKAVGYSVKSDSAKLTLSGKYSPIISADRYYRSDEVFWLARIIHAESNGESLLGQIAVGNVVMNRVRSQYYPNTIYGVIFDRKYGVQFSPVLNGTIYNTPCYNSTLAAKIALEGVDYTGGAFFFLRPELSTSSWIPDSRIYAFSIGKHDFYY